ncbi:MAG: glycerol-3-phosphate acyltransferase, partial [Candidatus Binatia bacterium]
VTRVLGKRLGLVTLIVDVAKGFFPVLVSSRLGFDLTVTALVALAAFLGHLYPIFLRFKGGKGVATALGVFLGIAPLVAAIVALLFALVVSISRRVSLASMAAAGAAPVLFWFLSYPPLLVGLSTTMALLVLFRHHENIRRLISGTEPRFQL